MNQRFFFCPKCGGRLHSLLRDGRSRLVCEVCQYVLYENPIVGVAGILMNGEELLLGRRSSASTFAGLWCIPCGYVEYDEDVWQAVSREFLEETGLKVEPSSVFTVLSNFHNPQTHTVGIWFMVRQVDGSLLAGDDLDQVAYFPLDSLPPLAFPTDAKVIGMLRDRIQHKTNVGEED